MTIHELIKELLKWPGDAEVSVSRVIRAPGSDASYPIVSITAYAGSRIDGRDSGLSLNIPARAFREDTHGEDS